MDTDTEVQWDLVAHAALTALIGAALLYFGLTVGSSSVSAWVAFAGAVMAGVAVLAGISSAGWREYRALPTALKAPVAVTNLVWLLAIVVAIGVAVGAAVFIAKLVGMILEDLGR